MKYIDAEKLIAEIRRIVEEETPISKGSDYYHGVADTADKLFSFIDSLHQEQTESYGLAETDTLESVHGWIARDKYNDPVVGTGLIFHHARPTRCADNGEWSSSTIAMHLSYDMFPDLKWEDDPIEVDLLFVKK